MNEREIQTILDAVCNYPKVQRSLKWTFENSDKITRIYFSLCYDETPALFVLYEVGGDEFLDRMRLN